MQQTILELTKRLIEIPSTDDNPKALKEVLQVAKPYLKGYSIETFQEFEEKGRPSLLSYNRHPDKQPFHIILNGHLDVVPAQEEQFRPYEKNGKLFGRGTYDMKAATAVEILVYAELASQLKYSCALQLVTDEEIGGFDGTLHQIQEGALADFVIVGEPTDFNIKHQSKGIMRIMITSKGNSAHGAYPWKGDNAIWKMHEVLSNIKKVFPVPQYEVWSTTVNVATIETHNHALNKVPDDCTIGLDIRYTNDEKDEVVKKLETCLLPNIEYQLTFQEPAHFTPKDHPYITLLEGSIEKILNKKTEIISAHGGSDIRHFQKFTPQGQGIEFGPIGAGHHTDEEWVDIQSLVDYYHILKDFLLKVNEQIS